MGRRPVRIKKKERWSTNVFRLFGSHARVDIVGQQTLDHEAGIFSAVKQNDLPGTLKLIEQDPQCLTLRDSVGAAPVHVAFLYGHVELGKQIVLKNRDLASLTCNTLDYTGQLSPYEGENILHIAIVQRRRGLARWLLQHVPELINAETIGKFFLPSKTCYFGGSPLLFALSSNQIDVAIDVLGATEQLKKLPIPPVRRRTTMSRHHVLVANGLLSKQAMAAVAVAKSGFAVLADAVLGENWDHENDGDPLFTSIFMCDSYGNNALHLAVLHDLPHVFDFAIQRAMQSLSPSHPGDNEKPEHLVAFLKRVDDMTHERILSFVRQRNCDELTPLSLAAAVGSTRMFQHILQSLTSVAWSYGPITAINIPLRDLEEPEPRPPFKYKGLVGLFHTIMSTLPYPLVPKGTSGYKTAIQCLCSYERLSCTISKSRADRFQQILANRLEMLKLVQINQCVSEKVEIRW